MQTLEIPLSLLTCSKIRESQIRCPFLALSPIPSLPSHFHRRRLTSNSRISPPDSASNSRIPTLSRFLTSGRLQRRLLLFFFSSAATPVAPQPPSSLSSRPKQEPAPSLQILGAGAAALHRRRSSPGQPVPPSSPSTHDGCRCRLDAAAEVSPSWSTPLLSDIKTAGCSSEEN